MRDTSESLSDTVYRRVAPPHFKIKLNAVASLAVKPELGTSGLSVFHAAIASPRQAPQARIEAERQRQADADVRVRSQAADWLVKNPDVETLVNQKHYRVVALPLSRILGLRLGPLEVPDESGHTNILGTAAQFEAAADTIVEWLDVGVARILTAEECLREP